MYATIWIKLQWVEQLKKKNIYVYTLCMCVCVYHKVCESVSRSVVWLWDLMDCRLPGSLPAEFSRQEYWSGLPFLLQGIFPNQGLNLSLLHFRQILYYLSHQGNSIYIKSLYRYLKNSVIFKDIREQTHHFENLNSHYPAFSVRTVILKRNQRVDENFYL